MTLTKAYFTKVIAAQDKRLDKKLQGLQKNIIGEVGKFLEEHVLEPIFGLKKDLAVVKKDVREVKHSIEQTNRRIDAVLDRGRISKLEEITPVIV